MEHLNKEVITNANLVKLRIMEALVEEGYISKEKASDFETKYMVIVGAKSWFQSVYARFFKDHKETASYYHIVKIIPGTSAILTVPKDDIEDNNDDENDLSELRFKLAQAESEENYSLAAEIKKKIESLKNKK